jgi:WD40 repeat protein
LDSFMCWRCLQVAWHPTKPTLLASSSMDGSVVAFQTDGSKVKALQHSSPASGCAWAQEGYLLATTSEAGAVYV